MNRFNKIFLFTYLLMILYGKSFAQWEKTNFPEKIKINTMAIKDSCIYAGTDGAGIFVSKDNGDNWIRINEGLKRINIHTIFIYGTTIFAGTEDGAYVSTNEGLNWRDISNGLSGQGVWSFAVCETNGELKIFAGTDHGVFTSIDNGESWAGTSVSNLNMPIHSIVAIKGYVFAATVCDGIYNSSDNGVTWTNISLRYNFEEEIIEHAIVPIYSLDYLNDNIIAGGYNGNFYTVNYKGNKLFLINPASDYSSVILCFTKSKDVMFTANFSGVIYKSVNQYFAWKALYYNLDDGAIYSLAVNNSYLFAGTEGGIWRLKDTKVNPYDYTYLPKLASSTFELQQNYPNPFNASTKIKYTVPCNGRVSLKVYNVLGKLVDDLVDRDMSQGIYEVEYSAGDLPSGIYFYSLVTNGLNLTKKLILLK